jgi:hypothetical protein
VVGLPVEALTAEDRAKRAPSLTRATHYLDTVERPDYQPTDRERAQRLSTAA